MIEAVRRCLASNSMGLASLLFAGAAHADAPAVPMSPEIAQHVPQDLRSYYLAFLVAPPTSRDMGGETFVEHQAYMRRKVEEGTYHAFGPLTDEGRIRGIIILTAESIEQAKKTVCEDPSVQRGVFATEVHPIVLPSLASLKISYGAPAGQKPAGAK